MKRSDGTLLDKYDGDIEFRFHIDGDGAAIIRWELAGRRWVDVASADLSPAALGRLRSILSGTGSRPPTDSQGGGR